MIVEYLGQLHKSVVSYIESFGKLDGELTGHQLRFLGLLNRIHKEKGVVLQRDLEACAFVNRSTVCGMLNSLEEKGYVRRKSCDSDGRANEIEITSKMDNIDKLALERVSQAEKVITESMDQTEQEQFVRLIKKAIENLDKEKRT